MAAKSKRSARDEGNRPSTFFIIAITVSLLLVAVAFIAYVARTPGMRPASTTTSVAALDSVA